MVKHIAVSVLGKDRPGIVAAVTKALFEAGCNIEDSSMTLLRSEFAMIVLVAVPAKASARELEKRLRAKTRALGLSVQLRPLSGREAGREKPAGENCVISVYGADQPGIVYRISRFLAERRVNITDVQTHIVNADKEPVYLMLLEAGLPAGLTPARLRKELGKIAAALKVNVTLNTVETPQL